MALPKSNAPYALVSTNSCHPRCVVGLHGPVDRVQAFVCLTEINQSVIGFVPVDVVNHGGPITVSKKPRQAVRFDLFSIVGYYDVASSIRMPNRAALRADNTSEGVV